MLAMSDGPGVTRLLYVLPPTSPSWEHFCFFPSHCPLRKASGILLAKSFCSNLSRVSVAHSRRDHYHRRLDMFLPQRMRSSTVWQVDKPRSHPAGSRNLTSDLSTPVLTVNIFFPPENCQGSLKAPKPCPLTSIFLDPDSCC